MKEHVFRGLGIGTGIVVLLLGFSSSLSKQVTDAVSSIGLFLALASWVASIYVWAKVPKKSILSYVALPILVLFGFMVGWVYLLFRSDVLARDEPDPTSSEADHKRGQPEKHC